MPVQRSGGDKGDALGVGDGEGLTVDEDLPVKGVDVGRVSGRHGQVRCTFDGETHCGGSTRPGDDLEVSERIRGKFKHQHATFAINDGQTLPAVEGDGCHVLGFEDVNCCRHREESWTIGGNNYRGGWKYNFVR